MPLCSSTQAKVVAARPPSPRPRVSAELGGDGVTASPHGVSRHDVVVLGSGAAGLTAALAAAAGGAEVGLYEKSELLGGTTAISGGVVWVPGNHLMDPADREDDPGEALRYLRALAGDALDVPVAEALVSAGPEMLRFTESASSCRFRLLAGYPDYHPDVSGARPGGGRSLEPDLFDLSVLGEWARRLCLWDGSPRPVLLSETSFGGATAPPPASTVAERRERGVCGMGEALVGSLLAGCLDAGVTVRTGARARQLVVVERGRVTGVRFDTPAAEGATGEVTAGEVTVDARRGVILATGGFEWNEALVRAFLRGPMDTPAGVPTNTGDGLDMAIDAGAALGNMAQAWWATMAHIPGEEAWGAPRYHLVLVERTRPGSIMVNGAGERFCNEAANYNALGGAFHQLDPATLRHANAAAWLVVDDRYRRRYALPGCRRGAEPPVVGAPRRRRSGRTRHGHRRSLRRHSQRDGVGVQPPCSGGQPIPLFGRGASVYDLFNGDRTLPGAAATLGTLDEPPFYAVAIRIGALGTSGGPGTDERGRVLSRSGSTIPGLWAAGNVMAAPTATVYAGAGGTLGPAMTFGYLAGRDAAG